MGWNHPHISLEQLLNLIKGFVDILLLLSGYQSSGRLAHWDSHNIKKAFQWGLFFEKVLGSFGCSDDYVGSMEELDAALSEMTSAASLPKGLAHLSSATLTTARGFVLEHLIHTLPLRDAHLRALLMATVEMDLEELSETEHDILNAYFNKLKLQNTTLQRSIAPATKIENCAGDGFTKYVVQELLKRWSKVSLISAVEAGLDVLSQNVRHNSWSEFDDSLLKEQLKHENAPEIVEWLVGSLTWNRWKSKNLSYFLDKRTIQLVSGASMIFAASKIQWVQIFERLNLNVSAGCSDDGLCETIELLLLGCITSRWTSLIEQLVSVSYDCKNISEQYHDVCNLLFGRSTAPISKQEADSDILEYLSGLLGSQLHQLWKISPSLVAVAIPSWSPLFRLYLSEIQIQFRGEFSTMRCCDCAHDMKEHNDCELAERIWCLYIFHVCGSHLIARSRDGD
ncbi:uncharacterized protein LOC110771326 isoform X2 [Prunus avium]|uniref:Uncharacterized protein LOC110771326 isoform X2 n=1 Tax=Prunus avium TaxID=42229 RepID=A0A6P5TWA8_PRUAV|nr:uncharacterized protein LOC110771326 isoform X2 [Prunus avium]